MERYLNMPIIAVTAFDRETGRDEFLAAGCARYISKRIPGIN